MLKLNYKCYKEVILYKKEPSAFFSLVINKDSRFSIKYQLGKISRNKPYMPGIFIYPDWISCFYNNNKVKISMEDFLADGPEIFIVGLECECSKPKRLTNRLELFYIQSVIQHVKNFATIKQHISYKKWKIGNSWYMSMDIHPFNHICAVTVGSSISNLLRVVEYLRPVRIVRVKEF